MNLAQSFLPQYEALDYSYPVKAQWIRILDVFLFGPVMIYGAYAARDLSPALRLALGVIGAGTIVYNGYNYWRIEQAKQLPLMNPDISY